MQTHQLLGRELLQVTVHPRSQREPVPLSIHHLPIAVSLALFKARAVVSGWPPLGCDGRDAIQSLNGPAGTAPASTPAARQIDAHGDPVYCGVIASRTLSRFLTLQKHTHTQ